MPGLRATLIAFVAVAVAGGSSAQSNPDAGDIEAAAVEMTAPVFEMFRLVPGQAEAFIRDMARWDEVSIAGGQPPTQLFLHAGGEGWDVLLYKPSRPKPTPDQVAAMTAKIEQMGLPTGALYFLSVREMMADHVHFEATGPMTAEEWVANLERQRAVRTSHDD